MSDVTGALQALAGGTASVDDVAGQFRRRQWPVRAAGQTATDTVAADAGDPEPEPDGGFGEVEAAYVAGMITGEQYAVLAEAAADGIKAQAGGQETKAGGPPLSGGAGGTKDAALVNVLARHEERVTGAGLPGWSQPGARAVLAVYDRGEQAWPGETKTILSRQDWALARVGAFLDLAAGGGMPGYVRDNDLLPDGHPARS